MTPFHTPRGFITIEEAISGNDKMIAVSQIKYVDPYTGDLDMRDGSKRQPKAVITLIERRAGVASEKIYSNDDLPLIATLINRSKG